MQDSVRRTIGSIAIAWNQAEDAVANMAALYLDVDTLTFELLVKPLRAQDREKLLRAVVAAKEFDEAIKKEIDEAIGRSKTCRENRNKILHRLGELDGQLTEESEGLLETVLDEINAECVFLAELRTNLGTVLFDRSTRDVPDEEGGTGSDELRPVAEFVAPERPAKPRQLQFDQLEVAE